MKVHIGPSPIAGTGCFATALIKKGEVIGDYTGPIISSEEADKRYHNREMTYLFDLGDGRYIDGDTDTNPLKYINHSCDGNCESDQDGDRIFIYALRTIKPGEELTYDYNLQVEPDETDPFTCHCGSKKCRGTMKGK
jgi:uncharacterized protein